MSQVSRIVFSIVKMVKNNCQNCQSSILVPEAVVNYGGQGAGLVSFSQGGSDHPCSWKEAGGGDEEREEGPVGGVPVILVIIILIIILLS